MGFASNPRGTLNSFMNYAKVGILFVKSFALSTFTSGLIA